MDNYFYAALMDYVAGFLRCQINLPQPDLAEVKLSGNQLFFITHIGVMIWAAFVVWLAVVTKNPAFIEIFFVPVLALPLVMP